MTFQIRNLTVACFVLLSATQSAYAQNAIKTGLGVLISVDGGLIPHAVTPPAPIVPSEKIPVPSAQKPVQRSAGKLRELERKVPSIFEVMLRAAFDFPSLRAAEQEIQATEHSRQAAIWNSFSVNAGRSWSNASSSSSTTIGVPHHSTVDSNGTTVGLQFSLSLNQWYSVQGIEINAELQRAALRAQRMTEAMAVGTSYLSYSGLVSQMYFLDSVLTSLEKIKKAAAAGQLSLSAESMALLEDKIVNFHTLIGVTETQYESARSDLKKYLGKAPINYFAEFKKIMRAEHRNTAANTPDLKWPGIDWNSLDRKFPIPPNAQTAYQKAMQSPAIVIANLRSELAVSQWYLALSSAGPFLNFNFSRNQANDIHGSDYHTTLSESDLYSVNLGFRIGGGLYHDLRSKGVLEEAAHLNERATRLNILNNLEKTYLKINSIKLNLIQTDHLIGETLFPALRKIKNVDEKGLLSVLGIYEALSGALQVYTNQLAEYQLLRINILTQTGTLIEDIHRMDGGKHGTRKVTSGRKRP